MRTTINTYLHDYLARGDDTAFAYRRGLRLVRWSYAQLAKRAFQFARELDARGMQKGDRVILWSANRPEWVAAFFGCTLRGVIVVPLDVESTSEFVARVFEQTSARIILHDADTLGKVTLGIPTLLLEALSETVSHHPETAPEPVLLTEADLVEIIYTSGTTAEPRGVCITHGNILANVGPLDVEIQKYMRWERLVHPLRFLNLLPLSHVFGQFMALFVPQLLGAEVLFQETLNPADVVSTIKRQKINVVVAVPRILDTLREHVERRAESRGTKLSDEVAGAEGWSPVKRWWRFRDVHRYLGLRFWAFVTGGASLSEESETFWRRLGVAVVQGYGMTETASLVTVNHPFKMGRGSVGKTLPGQEVRLDSNGEILVRGANVTPGYWKGDSKALEAVGGWLRTGDIGEMDEHGNIFFKGREKDVIVTAAGLNIYPEDIEAALNRQPEIKLSAVVGIDGSRGPEPMAVVILADPGSDPRPAIERANQTLARHQNVLRWVVWPDGDFPRTPTQKIKKRDLLKRLELNNGTSRVKDLTDSSSSPTIDETILRSIGLQVDQPVACLNASSKLATDLKLDSLGRVELLSALEDRYQIEIDEAAFTAATTIGDVEKIVRSGGTDTDVSARYPYPYWTQKFPITSFRVVFYYCVILPITSILCWVKVKGTRNLVEYREPLLFVSNHITYFDHALILSALPGRLRRSLAIAQEGERLRWWRRPPAGTNLFTRVRWLMQYFMVVAVFNTFSLPQKSGFRRSFAYAGESVDRGYSLLVFPEGTRTEDGQMSSFKSGIGLLATRLDIPVVPVRIEGLAELKLSGRRGFTAPGNVSVIFGEPVRYSTLEDPQTIASDLARKVRELGA